MPGVLEILNVTDGDTKITFDTSDVAEAIRARRIITDMMRRGYALLVEVADANGKKAFQRVRAFDETKGEYIIADFDAIEALNAELDDDRARARLKEREADEAADAAQARTEKKRGRPPSKRLPMHKTTATAVAPRVGG